MEVLDSVNNLLNNQTVVNVITLLLALYAALAAPALPNNVILFFDTLIGKLLLLFLIGYTASQNIQVSLMVAVAFVVTLHVINKRQTEEYINFLKRENFISLVQDTEEADSIKLESFGGAVNRGVERFMEEEKSDNLAEEQDKVDEEVDIDEEVDVDEEVDIDEEVEVDEEVDVDQPEEVEVAENFTNSHGVEEVDIEEFSNIQNKFHNRMHKWEHFDVKPSADKKDLFAPVDY